MLRDMIRAVVLITLTGLVVPLLQAQQSELHQNATLAHQKQMANIDSEQYQLLNQELDLMIVEATLEEALTDLAEQADLKLMYSESQFPIGMKISLQQSSITLYEALWLILKETDLKFAISANRQLVLLKDSEKVTSGDESLDLFQQIVQGQVVDAATGETLPGVNIVVEGTTIGTTTDIDGEYSINVPGPEALLVFSFIGYTTQQVTVGDQEVIDIELQIGVGRMDELVVVGYGTQRAETLTGSVASIGSRELAKSPAGNVGSSLQGLLPGLVSMQRTGEPGGDLSNILVRGQSTTGNNAPLVLVDGVPEPSWQRLNSDDIESISVLKDASAAIYGVQAANGVILITTKRGEIGRPVFTLTHDQGFVQPTRLPTMASSATLAEYSNEYQIRQGSEPMYTEEQIQRFRDGSDPDFYPDTDWQGEGFKRFALQNKTNLSVRGGSEDVRYSLSGTYENQDDIIRNGTHEFQNYIIRSNLDVQVNEALGLSLDLNAGMSDRNVPRYRSIGQLHTAPPTIPVYWPGGYPSNPPSDQGQHPMINNTGGAGYDFTNERRFSGKFSFNYNIPRIDGLVADGYLFYSGDQNRRKIWSTPWTYYSWNFENQEPVPHRGGFSDRPDLEERYSNYSSSLINLRLQYQQQFEDHYLNTFLAAEQSTGEFEQFSAYRRDFLSDALDELFAGSVANQSIDGLSNKFARQNLFGRVNYNFREKYLFDFNFRYDGSYRFPPDNRWGFFPGFSAAWRISQESFLRDHSVIDELKLRGSYGEMGNDEIPSHQYLQSYNLSTLGTFFGIPATPDPRIWAGVAANPNVTWEVATITNIGLDAELFNHSIGISVEGFMQRRSNILTTRGEEIPAYTALTLPEENIGVVENKGIEFQISHSNLISVGQGLRFSVNANVGFAKNKVVDVSEPAGVPDHQKMEGRILGAGLYYRAIGIFRTQEEIDNNPSMPGTQVGDLQYYDFDGDGEITANDMIRMNKSIHPDMTFGLNISAQYANFSLFSHFSGVTGADWWMFEIARPSRNAPAELLENRYTPGSMDSKYPWIPTWHPGMEVSGQFTDFWVEDASFLRLKTLEVSYSIPERVTSGLGINRMEVYLSGSNLFTISNIKNFDPEGANTGTNYGSIYYYPQTRVFNLGVQLTF